MNIDTLRVVRNSSAASDGNAVKSGVRAALVEKLPPPATTAKASAPETIRAAAAQIDSYLKSIGRTLDIRVDSDSGRTVVTVRDSTTGDVIRQIPNEEALQLARSLSVGDSGLPVVFDQLA